ncbi:MAG: hypothetical protein ACKO37_01370 [Vampirovibrionales bacterium]
MYQTVLLLLQANDATLNLETETSLHAQQREVWIHQGLDLIRETLLDARTWRGIATASFDPPDLVALRCVAQYVGIELFRGQALHLLDRTYQAAMAFSASWVVHIPYGTMLESLTPAQLIDWVTQAEKHHTLQPDLAWCLHEASGVSVVRFEALEKAFWECDEPCTPEAFMRLDAASYPQAWLD